MERKEIRREERREKKKGKERETVLKVEKERILNDSLLYEGDALYLTLSYAGCSHFSGWM